MDWSDPTAKLSKYFCVREALFLPAWEVSHIPSDDEKASILAAAAKMDQVRDFLGTPIIVHCWIRPTSANCPSTKWDKRNYNAYIGGAPGSAHIEGKAVDWNPVGMTCSEARTILVPKLEEFQVRMENIDGNWCHIDIRQPLPRSPRFFRP